MHPELNKIPRRARISTRHAFELLTNLHVSLGQAHRWQGIRAVEYHRHAYYPHAQVFQSYGCLKLLKWVE